MIGTEVLPNDLLLNITGGSLGRCAIVPENFQRGNVSQHVCIMRPIFVVSEYFHAFVLSSIFSKSMKITGSGREGLPKYNLERMFFPLPPLSEQHRIVSEIENWFALIDQIEQGKLDLQKVIKKAKNKILDLAIHGKLVPQDPNDEPASELLKRINPKAEITCDNGHYPVGWIDVILGDIFYHNTGKALNSSNKEGVLRNYLTTSNVYWNQFDLSLVKQMPFRDNELEKCTVQKGDLLVCEGGDVGRSAIWNFDYNICIQKWNVSCTKHNLTVPFPHGTDSDCCHGSDYCSNHRRCNGNQNRGIKGIHNSRVRNKIAIPFCRKSAPFYTGEGVVEGKYNQNSNRKIQKQENNCKINS